MQCKKFVDMDVISMEIKLHPSAKEYLFGHYPLLRKIFSDVLGQLDTEYISIALINQANQIFFLSSKPSIEQNLIEKNLWQYDGSYQPAFVYQDQTKLWNELPHLAFEEAIKDYKQRETGLIIGMVMSTHYQSYRAIFSFGFKQINPLLLNKKSAHCDMLLAMGQYALRRIKERLILPDAKRHFITRPKLELIINNQVVYEQTSG